MLTLSDASQLGCFEIYGLTCFIVDLMAEDPSQDLVLSSRKGHLDETSDYYDTMHSSLVSYIPLILQESFVCT